MENQEVKTVVNKLKNYVAFILDRSGSMIDLKKEIIGGFNANVNDVKVNAEKTGIETKVCLVTFSNIVDEPVLWLDDINNVTPLTAENYNPDGLTAMYDAVGRTIKALLSVPDANNEDVSFLIMVISDGKENNSKIYNAKSIADLVSECEGTGRWTFAYVGANQDLKVVSTDMNLSIANTLSYAATSDGYETMTRGISGSMDRYYSARTMGVSAMMNLFDTGEVIATKKKEDTSK